MKLPRNFTSRSFLVVGISVALYAAAALVLGWDGIRAQLAGYPPAYLLPLAGLTFLNYGLRYWRWALFLGHLDVRIPAAQSLKLYFATYVMVITPGKIGEVFKAGILRERFDTPLSKGIPGVLAERVYDFLAVFILAVVGVFFWPGEMTGMTTGLVLSAGIPVILLLLRHPGIRRRMVDRVSRAKVLARHRVGVDDSLDALGRLLDGRISGLSLALSLIAWFAECLGMWLVCRGLDFAITPLEAMFVYAAGTLVGSLTFLPGGLGGTEATIVGLLGTIGMPTVTGFAAALMVRLFTLWLAVVVGLGFFVSARELFGLGDKKTARPGDGPTEDSKS